MEQVLRTVRTLHADGMFCVEDEDDLTIGGGEHLTNRRIDEEAVAHHFARERIVRCLRDRVYCSRDGAAERMFFSCGGGRLLCRRLGGLFLSNCGGGVLRLDRGR